MMNSYETYMQSPDALSIEDVKAIYDEMRNSLAQCKVEYKEEIVKDLVESACYYAGIRASWEYMTREKKVNDDKNRTSAHDSFIRNLDITARMVEKEGCDITWRIKLGDNRKKIGDFGCYICWITAINNR